MRRTEALARQTADGKGLRWPKMSHAIRVNPQRLPTFWKIQIAGWLGFYVIVLVASFPYLKDAGDWIDNTLFVASLFVASLVLHPSCRKLWQRRQSWLALEIGASVRSVALAGVAAVVPYLRTIGSQRIDWSGWLVNFVQCFVVLVLWCNLYFSLKQWQWSQKQHERLIAAESEMRSARLAALQYQLNPHFLFNALNAVSTMILEGDALAANRTLTKVSELVRTTLRADPGLEVLLATEVACTQQYLDVERIRLGDRLKVAYEIADDVGQALVPRMLLQPLVENAVRHGIAPAECKGEIRISACRCDDALHLTVENSGAVFSPDSDGGIGLANTRERLATLYGSNQSFHVRCSSDGGCIVCLQIPLHFAASTEA